MVSHRSRPQSVLGNMTQCSVLFMILCFVMTLVRKCTADLTITPEILAWPREKYFYHELEELSVNYCLGYSHQLHGMACAIAEAAHLNRTLLLADQFCMSHFHNPTGKSVWRPFTDVFNISLLQKHARIEFHADPNAFIHELTPASSVVYLRNEIMTERLAQLTDIEVLVRMHRPWEHDPLGQWGYRTWWDHCFVNEDLANRMRALKGAFVPTDYTKRVAQAIMTKLGGSGKYCALHVRRGDKLPQVEGLDEATQPAAIYEKIKGRCPPGKVLYLATNEKDPHFFDDLKKHWKVFTYRDFMDELMPLGAFKWNETSQSYYVWDNLYLYQAEVLVIEAASPWMETFCILYKGPHQACDQAWQLDKNARVYGVDGYNGLVG